ncbi:MAG TPA: FG-GAP-like repeat-containing protein [Gaiellaceae bacterium]|nr:FG-GAP-like repeat-containing protein [Gaiellaceae bacterium]
MSAHAAPAPAGPTFTIRGRPYPVLLPKLSDPRLHLAAVIISLQIIGQVGFHFELSIAQILLAIGTCAVLEVAIAMRSQHVLLWPASATLTGNGVAFVLRVPGTVHGDWWSLRGWWIYVGTAAVSLLSKHVIRWRGEHIFNPSNIGLVLCFLLLGRTRAAPLDFWWGPMSAWLVVALAIIVAGGFLILRRLKLLRVALGFWASFAVAIGVLALAGHTMTARWHLGPISGFELWWVLVTSPEVLVFLFFMITDPKTAPRSPTGRLVYAVSLGLLAGVLIAPTITEYAAKVALLGSLAVVCLALPLLRLVSWPLDRRLVVGIATGAVAVSAAAMLVGNAPAVADASPAVPAGALPPITILPAQGVQTKLDLHTAQLIASDLLAARASASPGPLRMWLVQGVEQGPPTATVELAGRPYHLHQTATGHWALPSTLRAGPVETAPPPVSSALRGLRLTNVAPAVGLDFRQDSFRYGISNDYTAMMGGGVCWLDYNGDGWQDLFAVNSYSSADTARWEAHGGLPRTQLFENLHGHFRNVTASSHAGLQVQGDGCAAADLNGDGRPDLIVTTTNGIKLLWNNGNGTFGEGARAAGMTASGWYTGVAVADVNGDGRPDVFVAGYTRPYESVPNSLAGFPTNLVGVRDLLYLNEGNGSSGRARFREVGVAAGLEASNFSHALGATFLDVNGDGRPDLYVANDEDPNQFYVNVPWPGGAQADPAGLGFRFENRATASGVADPYAGMGVAVNGAGRGPLDLFVTNSRHEPSAAFARTTESSFTNARPNFDPALGADFAGWGDTFVDLRNSGDSDLVLATGGIPVTNLGKDAGQVKVIAPLAASGGARYGLAPGVITGGLRVNGRGLAAADVDNNGRMEIAVNSIGGKLLLLKPTGPIGHWLDVKLSRFTPGALVTLALGGRNLSQEVRAGSSYLSSADGRIHFGLGAASKATRLTVRYPWGGQSVLRDVRADRIVHVAVPARPATPTFDARSYRLPACTPTTNGRSVATVWDDAAVDALRSGGASEPVQARDLFDVSSAMWDAWKAGAGSGASAREAAISYAAYRVLLWDVSFDSNLSRTFALLTRKMRGLCYSPEFTTTAGSSPAALGNRIAAATIAAGRRDGSNESLHYADPTFTSTNQPLIVHTAGSTVENAALWQPLALGAIQPHSLAAVPADVQSFVGAEWGHVRSFALPRSRRGLPIDPGASPLQDPTSAGYRRAAVAVLRATSGTGASTSTWSPLTWNLLATRSATGNLATDVRLYLGVDGALNDAAVAAWGAKRAYQPPRPISMIRYLAFQGQSSDRKQADYNAGGLPLVPGLVEIRDGKLEVLSRGRWVDGAAWSPPVATPPSPGGVAEGSAFAYAAGRVLSALTGRSFAAQIRAAGTAPLAAGIDVPSDLTAGRTLGEHVAADVLRRLRRYGS